MNKQPAEKLTLSNNRDSMHVHILSKVRLNRYDTKFMSNIFEKYISQGKPLSAGQNELYEKIVHKYRKQLKKLRVNYKDILALPWENGIADPNALNQKTYFQITDDDEMRLYFNFNKTHIDEVRSLVHDDAGNHLNRGADQNFGNGQRYSFEWNKAEKIWHGPFNLHLFKTLYEWCLAHKIQIDDSVKDLVAKLDSHGSKEEWTPGVRIVHGRMYINIIAESMLPMLEDIDMGDVSVRNIERLGELGLAAPGFLSGMSPYLMGQTSNDRHIIRDIEDVDFLRDYVIQTGRKVVFHIPELFSNKNDKHEQLQALSKCESWGTQQHVLLNTPMYPSYRDHYDTVNIDNLVNEGYNTLITTTTLASLLSSQAAVGKFALEADKIIYLTIRTT